MLSKDNWAETRERFNRWWKRDNRGRPLLSIIARRPDAEALPDSLRPRSQEQRYLDAHGLVARYRHFCENHRFLAESFPNLSVDLGPGSLAAYLGSDVLFQENTIWFEPAYEDLEAAPTFAFDPESPWWQKHFNVVQEARRFAGDDFLIGIPDIMENVDVLASLRGGTELLYDMIDYPDEVEKRIQEIDDCYFDYYDRFYDVVSAQDGSSCYTVFQVWGSGRMAKLQCDFSAVMSPTWFDQFVVPSLTRQSRRLDQVLYHLVTRCHQACRFPDEN